MNSSPADNICPSLPPELSTDTCTFSGSCFGKPSLLIQDNSPTSPSWCVAPNSTGGPVVLYTDIPYVSKIVRVVGHVAVTNYARTKIYELRAWPYISTNNGVWILEGMKDITKPILFGKPRKYLPIAVPPGAEWLWDEALEEEAVRWHRKIHLGVSSNCHTFVSDVLNNLHNRLGGKGKPHSFLSLMWDVCHRGVPILSDSVRHSGWKWVFSDHRKLWLSVLETCIGLHRPIDPKCRRQLNRSTTQYVFPLLSRVVKPIAELLYGDLRSPSEKRDAERRVGLWHGYATGEDCGVALKGQEGRERRVGVWRAAQSNGATERRVTRGECVCGERECARCMEERRVGMGVGDGQVAEWDGERRVCEWKHYDSDDDNSDDSFYNGSSTDLSDDDNLIEMHGADTDGNNNSDSGEDDNEDTRFDTSIRISSRNHTSARVTSPRSTTGPPQASHHTLQATSSTASSHSSSALSSSPVCTAESGCAVSSTTSVPVHHTHHTRHWHHAHPHGCHDSHHHFHHHHFCCHSHHYQHHHSAVARAAPSPHGPSSHKCTPVPRNDTIPSAPAASHSPCLPPCGTRTHTSAVVPLLRNTPRSPLPDIVPNSHNTHMHTPPQVHGIPHIAPLLRSGPDAVHDAQHSANTTHSIFARSKRLLAATPPPAHNTRHHGHAPIRTPTHIHTCGSASRTKTGVEDCSSTPAAASSPMRTSTGTGAGTSKGLGTNTRPGVTSPIAHLPHSPYVRHALHQPQHSRTPPLRHQGHSPSTLTSAHTHTHPSQVNTHSTHTRNLAPQSLFSRASSSTRTHSPQPQHQPHSPPPRRSDTAGPLPPAATSAPITAGAPRVGDSRIPAQAHTNDTTARVPLNAGEDVAKEDSKAVEATTLQYDASPATAPVMDPVTATATTTTSTAETVTVRAPPQRLPTSLSLQLPQTLPQRLRRANTCKSVSTLDSKLHNLSSFARTKLPATPSSLLQPRRPLLVYYSATHRYMSKSPTIAAPHRTPRLGTPKAPLHGNPQGDAHAEGMAMVAIDVPDSSSLYAELRDLYPSAFAGHPERSSDTAMRHGSKELRYEAVVEERGAGSREKSVTKMMHQGLESTAAVEDIGVKDAAKPDPGAGMIAVCSAGTGTGKGMGAASSAGGGARDGSDGRAQRPPIPYSCRPAELGYWRSGKRHPLNDKGIGKIGEHVEISPVPENSTRKFRILPQSCPNMLSKSAYAVSAKLHMGSKPHDAAAATEGPGEGKEVFACEEDEREAEEDVKEEARNEPACRAGHHVTTITTIPAITIDSRNDDHTSTLSTNASREVTPDTHGRPASATCNADSSRPPQQHAAPQDEPCVRGVRCSVAEGFYSHIYAAQAAADETAQTTTRLRDVLHDDDLHAIIVDKGLHHPDLPSRCGEGIEDERGAPVRGVRRHEERNPQDEVDAVRRMAPLTSFPCRDSTSQAHSFVFTANSRERSLHSPQRRNGSFDATKAALRTGNICAASTNPLPAASHVGDGGSGGGDNACCERRTSGIGVKNDCLETEGTLSTCGCGVPVAACVSQTQCDGCARTCQGAVAYIQPPTLRQCDCADVACSQRDQRYRRSKSLRSEDTAPSHHSCGSSSSQSGATPLSAAVIHTACESATYHHGVAACTTGRHAKRTPDLTVIRQRRQARGSNCPRRVHVRSSKSCGQASAPNFDAAAANAASTAAEAAARCTARDSNSNPVTGNTGATDPTMHAARYGVDGLWADAAPGNSAAEKHKSALHRGVNFAETVSAFEDCAVPPPAAPCVAEVDNDEHNEPNSVQSSCGDAVTWCGYGPKSDVNRTLALNIGGCEGEAPSATLCKENIATCGNVDNNEVWPADITIDVISHVDSVDAVSPQDYRLTSHAHPAPKQVRVARNHFPSSTHTSTTATHLPANASGIAILPATAALPKSSSKDSRAYIDPATLSSSALYASLASQRTYPAFTAHHDTHAPSPLDPIQGHFGFHRGFFGSHHSHVGVHGPRAVEAVLSPAEEAYYIPTHAQRKHYEQRRSRSRQSSLTDTAAAKDHVHASIHARLNPLPVSLSTHAAPAPPGHVCSSHPPSTCFHHPHDSHCDECDECGKSSTVDSTAVTILHSCVGDSCVHTRPAGVQSCLRCLAGCASCTRRDGTREGELKAGCTGNAMDNAGITRANIDPVATVDTAPATGAFYPRAISASPNTAADLAATYSQSSWLRSNISLYNFTATQHAAHTNTQRSTPRCARCQPHDHLACARKSTAHATLQTQATPDPHTCCSTVNQAPHHVHPRAPTCPQSPPNPQTTTPVTDAQAHISTETGVAAPTCSCAAVPPPACTLTQCCRHLCPLMGCPAGTAIGTAAGVRVHAPIAAPAASATLELAPASTSTAMSTLPTIPNPANTANAAPNAPTAPQAAFIVPTAGHRTRLTRSRSTPDFPWPTRSTTYNSKLDQPDDKEQRATQGEKAQQSEHAVAHAAVVEASLVDHPRSNTATGSSTNMTATNGENDSTYTEAHNSESTPKISPKSSLPVSTACTDYHNISLTAGSRLSLDSSVPPFTDASAPHRAYASLSCAACNHCSCAAPHCAADLQSGKRVHGHWSCAHAHVYGAHVDLRKTGAMTYASNVEAYRPAGEKSGNEQFSEKKIYSENSSLPEIRSLPASGRGVSDNGDINVVNERLTPQPSMFARDGKGKRTYPCVIVDDSPRDDNRDKPVKNHDYYANKAGGCAQYRSVYNPYAEDAPYSPNSFYERERTRFVNEAPLTPPSIPVLIHNAVGALTEKAVRVTAHSVAHLLRRMYGVYREIVSEPVRATMRGCVERMVQVLQEECDDMATYERARRESISRARGDGGGGGIGVSTGGGGGEGVNHARSWTAGNGREKRCGWGERGEGEGVLDEDALREREWRRERRRLRERAKQHKERENRVCRKDDTGGEHTHERKRKICD